MRDRHSAYYARLADSRWREFIVADDLEWRTTVDAETANLHEAVEWALERGHGEDALAIVSGIWPAPPHVGLMRSWIERALALPAERTTRRRAYAVGGLGDMARTQGDFKAAVRAYEEALALGQELRDDRWIAAALTSLADMELATGDRERARRLAEKSVDIRRNRLDGFGLSRSLNTLVEIELADDELDGAKAFVEEAVALLRAEHPNSSHLPESLEQLGEVCRRRGERAEAIAAFTESLRLGRKFRGLLVVSESLDGLAALDLLAGDAERAACLGGAAQGLRELIGVARQRPTRPVPERVEPMWSQGAAFTLDEAVDYALASID